MRDEKKTKGKDDGNNGKKRNREIRKGEKTELE